MESSPVSWQFENFSSAELSLSPPVSPSPPSPSLYNGVPVAQISKDDVNCASAGKPELSTRAKLATCFLNELEQNGADQMDSNDFGMNWNEESINLNLFEELADVEYTPPVSPCPKPSIGQTTDLNVQLAQASHLLNSNASDSSADIAALTAEFQAILDSLPKDTDNTEILSQVLEIAGIPTTVIDGEALVPVELDFSTFTYPGEENTEMEEEMSLSGHDSDIIDESELYGMSDMSSQGSPASSVHSEYDYGLMGEHHEIDEHSHAAEKILDALLVGDVVTAEAFLPVVTNTAERVSTAQAGPSNGGGGRKAVVERRGRKPAKKPTKGSSGYIKDKALRKKEQNKTAATRYRQKKKMELGLILDNEAELAKEHDDLEKMKDDLNREILMVKQLLRDVLKAKKPSVNSNKAGQRKGKVSLVTASTLVARNRRM